MLNERPTDMSNYRSLVLRIAATNSGGNVASVGVQYFLQSGGFNYHTAGPDQVLPADGEYHYLCFPIAGIANLDFVEQHGINLGAHAGGDLVINIDGVRPEANAECPDPGRVPLLYSREPGFPLRLAPWRRPRGSSKEPRCSVGDHDQALTIAGGAGAVSFLLPCSLNWFALAKVSCLSEAVAHRRTNWNRRAA